MKLWMIKRRSDSYTLIDINRLVKQTHRRIEHFNKLHSSKLTAIIVSSF